MPRGFLFLQLRLHRRRIARDREGTLVSRGARATADVGLYFVIESPDWSSALAHAASCPVADPGMIDVFELDDEAELDAEDPHPS